MRLKTSPRLEPDPKDNLSETDLRIDRPNEPNLVLAHQGTGHRQRAIALIPNQSRPSSARTTEAKTPKEADSPGDQAEEEEDKATLPNKEDPPDPEALSPPKDPLLLKQWQHPQGQHPLQQRRQRRRNASCQSRPSTSPVISKQKASRERFPNLRPRNLDWKSLHDSFRSSVVKIWRPSRKYSLMRARPTMNNGSCLTKTSSSKTE